MVKEHSRHLVHVPSIRTKRFWQAPNCPESSFSQIKALGPRARIKDVGLQTNVSKKPLDSRLDSHPNIKLLEIPTIPNHKSYETSTFLEELTNKLSSFTILLILILAILVAIYIILTRRRRVQPAIAL